MPKMRVDTHFAGRLASMTIPMMKNNHFHWVNDYLTVKTLMAA